MAACNFNIDTDFLRTLDNLENIEQVTAEILKEGANIITETEKREISHIQTGDMKNSIKPTKVKKNQYGQYIVVRPTGKSQTYVDRQGGMKDRKTTVRNMEKFVYNEYGTSQQSANPIQQKVVKMTASDIESVASKIMQRIVK